MRDDAPDGGRIGAVVGEHFDQAVLLHEIAHDGTAIAAAGW